MVVKQVSVFIENKEGRIKKAINTLSSANVNIRALSIADGSKFGILRLIVSDNKKAKEALESEGFLVKETEVIVVGVPDKPNGLNSTLEILDKHKINLEYIYAFISNKTDEAIVVMRLENMTQGMELLKSSGANILSLKNIKNL